jgi:hypothetical protein
MPPPPAAGPSRTFPAPAPAPSTAAISRSAASTAASSSTHAATRSRCRGTSPSTSRSSTQKPRCRRRPLQPPPPLPNGTASSAIASPSSTPPIPPSRWGAIPGTDSRRRSAPTAGATLHPPPLPPFSSSPTTPLPLSLPLTYQCSRRPPPFLMRMAASPGRCSILAYSGR